VLLVLSTDLNNSEIRYTKKLCILLTGGVYTPYSPCMSTPLLITTLSYRNIQIIKHKHARRCVSRARERARNAVPTLFCTNGTRSFTIFFLL